MPKLTDRSAISTNINEDLLIHVVDTTTTDTSYKATLSQLYAIFPKNTGAGSAGYVARWTAANELGIGVIQDDGTRTAINATPETNSAGRMLYIQGDTGGGAIHITNSGQTSAGGRYLGVEAEISESNVSNTGIYGSASGSTEANIGVIGRVLEYDTSGVGVGCYGFFGNFGDAKVTLDYTGKQGVGMAGTTVAEGEIGVLGMVESSQAQNAVSQYGIWGQVELTGSTTSAKDEAYVYYSKGVNGNGSGNHSINTAYHLYLEGHSSTVNTNSWGIYQAGASDKNYFAGSVGINDSNPSSFTRLSIVSKTTDATGLDVEFTSTGNAFGAPQKAIAGYVNPTGSVGTKGLVGLRAQWGGNYDILTNGIRAAIYSSVVSFESSTSLHSLRADGVEAADGHTIDTAYVCFVGSNRTSGTGAITTRYGIYQSGGSDLNVFKGNIKADSSQIWSEVQSTLTPTGTTQEIDWNDGNVAVIDLESASSNVAITFANPQAGAMYFIKIIQDSTLPLNVTWPVNVKFPSGTAPTISTGANAIDAVALTCISIGGVEEYLANYSQDYQA